jgi:hypothetical protein
VIAVILDARLAILFCARLDAFKMSLARLDATRSGAAPTDSRPAALSRDYFGSGLPSYPDL